jgi:hypothetical protein
MTQENTQNAEINETQAEVTEDTQSVQTEETPKVFSQEELDKILTDRISRERKKLDKFADYDDLKTKASEYEQLLEEKRLSELSEKERLEEIARKHEEEKQSLAQELESMRESVNAEKIRNAFNQIATSQNVNHLDDAFVLADLSAVTVEDGKVVGMEDAIKALVDNKPFLLAKKQPTPIGESTNGNTERADKTAEQLLKEAAAKAKASGRNEDRMAYAALKAELNK